MGILSITWTVVDQLLITLLENIILAIYLIILAIIERYRMDEIFKYTTDAAKIGKSKMMKNYNQRKAKKLQMNYLLHKVKNSSSITF